MPNSYLHGCKKGKDDELNPAEEMEQDRKQEETEEVRQVKALAIPTLPSREEVLRHRLTHRPFRLWCPHCVRGKGREGQHRISPQKDEFQGIPQRVSDYFYIGQRRAQSNEEREAAEA